MSIIMRRILSHLQHLRPEQSRFTTSRSTSEFIITLRVLAEQRRAYRQILLAAFVDLKSAFDSIDRECLWKLLQGIGIPHKLINIIRA